MSNITDKIDALFAEKKLPLTRQNGAEGFFEYRGVYSLNPQKPLHFSLVVQDKDDIADFQITYSNLYLLTDYSKKEAMLAALNEMNQYKAGYFTLMLKGDGEIFMRTISKMSVKDIQPMYELLVIGSNVAHIAQTEIEKVATAK